MKLFTQFASFSALFFTVSLVPVAQAETALEICKSESELAETIMSLRQQGAPMHRLMSISSDDPDLDSWMKVATMLAYDRERAGSESGQQWQIDQFRDDMYRLCIDKLTGKSSR